MKCDRGASRRSGRPRGALSLPPVLVAVACLCLHGHSGASESVTPRISQVVVSSSPTHLVLFARLAEAFDAEMLDALREGMPLRVEFQVEIFRERRMWPDSLMAAVTLARTLKYDPVQARYEFAALHGAEEIRRGTSIREEALRWTTSVDGVPVMPRGELRGGRRYYLRVRAVIAPDQDPLARNIYFFKKSSRRETDWRQSPLFGIGGKREP